MLETTIEELIEAKRKEGFDIGFKQAKMDTILRGIKLGYDTNLIHDFTEVSIETIENMRQDIKK